MPKFSEYMLLLDDYDYLFSRIASQTAPTLLHIKPSSLLSLTNNSRHVLDNWAEYKYDICSKIGLNFIELLVSEDRLIILFYRVDRLAYFLKRKENIKFLEKMGYPSETNLQDKLDLLKQRFIENCPHEIGVFLGFPVADVIAFIEQRGAHPLLCGYWKVYHNPERALIVFRNYDMAREIVIKALVRNHTHKLFGQKHGNEQLHLDSLYRVEHLHTYTILLDGLSESAYLPAAKL